MNKKIKVILSLMMFFSLVCSNLSNIQASNNENIIILDDDTSPTNGNCGDEVYWKITDDGKLIINGYGVIDNLLINQNLKSKVKEIIIENGITGITSLELNDFTHLVSLIIPNSVNDIGNIEVNDGTVIFVEKGTAGEQYVLDYNLNYRYQGDESYNIYLNYKDTTTLYVNNGLQIKAIITPEDAYDQRVVWASSNENVAIVNQNGYVKAKNTGVCSISATLRNGKKAQCQIKVLKDITKCSISNISDQSYTGKEIKPTITVKYGSLLLKKDKDYAVLYKNNKNPGTATITITGKGEYGGKVEKNFKIQILPSSIKLNANQKTLARGKTFTLKATLSPTNVTNKKIIYTSSNPSVATVTSTGTVKAVNYGTADITVKTSNGKTAKCKVTVPYTVKYNLNGGTNHTSNPTYYYGKKVTLKNPTRKGYAFAGWYSDSKYKTKVTSFSSGNKTLYAKWQKVTVARNTVNLSKYSSNKIKITYSSISGTKGYQIQYATNLNFTSSKTYKTSSRTYITPALTRGKRYYVRVRGYKVDSTGKTIYGSWSSVKSLYISNPPKPSTPVTSMVYVSKTGSKYHRNPNCSNMKNPSCISINEAKSRGLGPCSKCY